jgi:hypothetical protein
MKRIIIILVVLFFVRCSKDDDMNNSENQIDINLVSGINLINNFGIKTGEFGNPNILNNNNFDFFPNPAIDILNLYSMENVTKIWIRPANSSKNYLQTNFELILNSELYSENEIESGAELKFIDSNLSGIKINLRSLEPGYYKLFVKANEKIYWENIFVGEVQDLINYWN